MLWCSCACRDAPRRHDLHGFPGEQWIFCAIVRGLSFNAFSASCSTVFPSVLSIVPLLRGFTHALFVILSRSSPHSESPGISPILILCFIRRSILESVVVKSVFSKSNSFPVFRACVLLLIHIINKCSIVRIFDLMLFNQFHHISRITFYHGRGVSKRSFRAFLQPHTHFKRFYGTFDLIPRNISILAWKIVSIVENATEPLFIFDLLTWTSVRFLDCLNCCCSYSFLIITYHFLPRRVMFWSILVVLSNLVYHRMSFYGKFSSSYHHNISWRFHEKFWNANKDTEHIFTFVEGLLGFRSVKIHHCYSKKHPVQYRSSTVAYLVRTLVVSRACLSFFNIVYCVVLH